MALGSLLLFLALLIIVSLIVARPLVEGRDDGNTSPDQQSHWLAERERVLDALGELDADWQLGKVPEEIYVPQRKALVAKGAKAIEELEKTGRTPRSLNTNDEDDLETLINAYKRRVSK
jgi:hypothetical protein